VITGLLALSPFDIPFSPPEHPRRFTELSREEKEEGGDRGDMGEKRECQKGREQASQ